MCCVYWSWKTLLGDYWIVHSGYWCVGRRYCAYIVTHYFARGIWASKEEKAGKKPRLELQEGSHSYLILALSKKMVQNKYLASGSDNNTAQIRDVWISHSDCTLTHHSDEVQSAQNPSENENAFLTGGFDKRAYPVDENNKEIGTVLECWCWHQTCKSVE